MRPINTWFVDWALFPLTLPLPPLSPLAVFLPLFSAGDWSQNTTQLSEGSTLSGTHSQSVRIDQVNKHWLLGSFPLSLHLPAGQTHCLGSATSHFPWKVSNSVPYSFSFLLIVNFHIKNNFSNLGYLKFSFISFSPAVLLLFSGVRLGRSNCSSPCIHSVVVILQSVS